MEQKDGKWSIKGKKTRQESDLTDNRSLRELVSNPTILRVDDWQNDKENGKASGLGISLGEKMSSVFSKSSEWINQLTPTGFVLPLALWPSLHKLIH